MSGRRRLGAAALGLGVLLVAVATWPAPPLGPTGQWMAEAGVSPQIVEAAGIKVRLVRKGRGSPVVLLHGFASSLYTWKEVLPELARSHDVIALDLPGHGGSDIPSPLTPEHLARVVPEVLDRLGVPRAALVGNSLGGALALVTAVRQPERVSRLVLIDAAGFNFAPAQRPLLLRALVALPGVSLLERSPRRHTLVRLGLRQVFHDDARVTPERIDEYLAPILRPGAVRGLRHLLAGGEDLGFPGIVGQVGQPTLVVWGRQDSWIPVADAERFRAALPSARVAILEDCGHMPQEERPQETAQLINEFLN